MDQVQGPKAVFDVTGSSSMRGRALRALGRFLHRFRWGVVVIVGLLFAVHFAGADQKEDDVVRARTVVADKYEILGPNGKTAAMFYRSDAGHARLVFLDANQGLRLAVGISPDGAPALTMLEQNNKVRMNLTILPKGSLPRVEIYDDDGNAALSLGMTEDFGPSIWLGTADKGRVSVGLSKQGEPWVMLWAKNDEPRLALALTDGAPTISLFDANKVLRTRWKLARDGSPSLSLLDGRSRERLLIGTDNADHPFIKMIDPDKNAFKEIR